MNPNSLWVDQVGSAIWTISACTVNCGSTAICVACTCSRAVRTGDRLPMGRIRSFLFVCFFHIPRTKCTDPDLPAKPVRIAIDKVVAAVVAEYLSTETAVVPPPEERKGRPTLEAYLCTPTIIIANGKLVVCGCQIA